MFGVMELMCGGYTQSLLLVLNWWGSNVERVRVYFPGVHLMQVSEPIALYVFGRHILHVVSTPDAYFPAEHFLHVTPI